MLNFNVIAALKHYHDRHDRSPTPDRVAGRGSVAARGLWLEYLCDAVVANTQRTASDQRPRRLDAGQQAEDADLERRQPRACHRRPRSSARPAGRGLAP